MPVLCLNLLALFCSSNNTSWIVVAEEATAIMVAVGVVIAAAMDVEVDEVDAEDMTGMVLVVTWIL